jgi:hypothetical protein
MNEHFSDEFLSLLNAACDGMLIDSQFDELESILNSDVATRKVFIDHIQLRTDIWLLGQAEKRACDGGLARVQAMLPGTSSSPPVMGILDNAIHGTISYFSAEMPFAYLVATVLFGLGLWFCSFIYVSSPEQYKSDAQQIADASPRTMRAVMPPERMPIGRVSGLVNCRWSDSHTVVYLGRRVAAGDTFALASGLVEITYDTGARVVVQGPATYQVDSPRGGFLSVGKLTARVEKKAANSQDSNLQSPPPNSPLFAVRTPTAVVTDLGTEFGVEVSESGETCSHVFRGSVQLQETRIAEGQESSNNTIILHANEAASVKIQPGDNEKAGKENTANENKLVLSRGEFNATAFVLPDQMRQYAEEQRLKPLRRWQAYSRELRKDPSLVAYYDFQMKGDNCSLLPNLSAAGSALDGRVKSGEWVDGRLPGKMALYFRGPYSQDRIELPDPDRFEFPGAFTVAVWFKLLRCNMKDSTALTLIAKADDSWRVHYVMNCPLNYLGVLLFDTNEHSVQRNQITPGHTCIAPTASDVSQNPWRLVVAAYPVCIINKRCGWGRQVGTTTASSPA